LLNIFLGQNSKTYFWKSGSGSGSRYVLVKFFSHTSYAWCDSDNRYF